METVSENRGRPPAFTEDELALAKFAAPGVRSHRQLMNVAYRQRAVALLANDSRFAWLCESADMEGGRGHWQPAILAELGRLRDADSIREAATVLCDHRPTTPEAIAYIRRLRGLRPKHSAPIDAALKAYRRLTSDERQQFLETAIGEYLHG